MAHALRRPVGEWHGHKTPWDPTWILGFIDYASIGPYFAQTPYNATPQMLAGGPFSRNDFPVYGFQLLVVGEVRPGLTRHWTSPPAGAGPLVPAANLRLFIAGTPTGRQTLSASYVMYVPPEQYWPTTYHTWPPGA